MSHTKKVTDKIRYIVKYAKENKDKLLVEIIGKKKALKAAGLPTNLRAADPATSRWGQVISLAEAKKILS